MESRYPRASIEETLLLVTLVLPLDSTNRGYYELSLRGYLGRNNRRY